jgi:hypothetical protein
MKEIEKLKSLLAEASHICESNIDNAHNMDLESMSQVLDEMIRELIEIGDFESYDDEDEE